MKRDKITVNVTPKMKYKIDELKKLTLTISNCKQILVNKLTIATI